MNEKWTSHWTDSLTRLTEILEKLESRSSELADSGVDTAEVDAAISDARAAVDSAQDAINAQAANVYEINFEDESTLREDIQPIVTGFREEMRETFSTIKTAKEAVRVAFTSLKKLSGLSNADRETDE